jgi:hypothetical protein
MFSSDGRFSTAEEWTVRPGATAVERREIAGFDNGEDLTAEAAPADGLQQERPRLPAQVTNGLQC